MFAVKPRMETTFRVLLIAVVLFNSIIPVTIASADNEGGTEKDSGLHFPLNAKVEMITSSNNNNSIFPGLASEHAAQAKNKISPYQIENCQISGDLVVANEETCSLEAGSYTYNSIHIQTGGTLNINGNPTLNQGVTINSSNLTIDAGGKIDANGNGYEAPISWVDGNGPGGGTRGIWGAGGGGYGGNGQTSAGDGGTAYGSVITPVDLGSSGGTGKNGIYGYLYLGGNGGGAIHLNISETLTINGEISANGNNGDSNAGAGSGGSILVETNALVGSGIIRANGGTTGGGGGGGRIAIYYVTSSLNLDWQHIDARGGNSGGPGTIYLKNNSNGGDKLFVDNGGGTTTTYAGILSGDYSFDEIEVNRKGALRVLGDSSSLTFDNDTISGDGTGRLEAEGIVHAPQSLTLTNITLAILGDLPDTQTINLSGNGKLELHAISTLNDGVYTFSDITVGNGTTLKLVSYDNKDSDYTNDRGVELRVTNNLTVAAGGKIDASGTGYVPVDGYYGSGPGAGQDMSGGIQLGGGGAGYGGLGQSAAGSGGVVYGSASNPVDLGSSGGSGGHYSTYAGGTGGGAMHLIVGGTFTMNGEISADAGVKPNPYGGGGSGGGIWIETTSLVGTGTVHANGATSNGAGGRGAGGRIAIYAESSNHTITFSALGGVGYELVGEGTVYFDSIGLANSTVDIMPEQLTANGSSMATITVTVKNEDGYPVPNKSVEVGLISGARLYIRDANSIDQLAYPNDFVEIGNTNANGEITTTLKAFISGTRILRARIDGQAMISEEGTVEFVPGPVSANMSDLSASSSSAPANGQTPITITVTANDAYNNRIPNASVEWNVTGNATFTQSDQTTNAQGVANAQVVNSTSESVTVTAIVNGVDLDNEADLTFTAADLALSASATSEALPDTSLEYNITVHNISGLTIEGATLVVELPEDVTFTNHTAPDEPVIDGQELSWELGTFDAGEKLSFAVIGHISVSTPLDSQLTMQANVSSSTADGNLSNNTSTVTTIVVDGHGFTTSINPSNQVLAIGAIAAYEITIKNTGLVADQFNLSLSGLDPAWFTLADTTVTLSPQQTTQVSLKVQINSCSEAGVIPFGVTVTSAAEQEIKTLDASVEYDVNPLLSGFTPGDGVLLGSPDVTISWRSDVPTTGTLTVIGLPEPFTTPAGMFSSVVVPDLDLNTTYEWYVETVSPCGTTTSSHRQFTIGNGIVFENRNQNVVVNRDYDQRVTVTVRNEDTVDHTLKVFIPEELNPYKDILVNFVDSGSQDQTIDVPAQSSRNVTLAIHAQDAESTTYDLTAMLVADEAQTQITDNMTLHFTVLKEGNFTIVEDEDAFDSLTLGRTYVITNHGKPITDLSLKAVDPVTGLPAKIFLQPSLDHMRIETGQSIRVVAYPIFTAEDAVAHANLLASLDSDKEPSYSETESETITLSERSQLLLATYPIMELGGFAEQASQLASGPANLALDPGEIDFDLVGTGAGFTEEWTGEPTSCGTTRQIIPVTMQDCTMTFETESWYCTNRPEISTPIQVPAFLRNENIVSTLLKMTFQPHGNVLNHSSQYNFNDGLIGSFTNTVPSGQKIFSVPTSNWNNGVAGNVLQIVDTFTQHSNDAHYVSVADYQLEVNIDQATTFVCADSSSSAQAIVQETYACNASTGYVFNPLTDVYWGSVLNAGQNKTTVITANVETDGNVSITSCSTQEACGDPINTQTGVLSFTLADMSFPTSAGNLVFQRSYTSGALENAGVLGHGWTHNHESKLIFPTDPGGIEDYVLFQSVLGNQFLFKNETDGSFTPGPGVIASLTKSSTTPVVYTLTDSQQAVFQFNEDGRLSLRKDVQGHEFDYEYDTEGKLTEVSADNGARFIQLGYDDQDRIDVVSNHASQQVAFVYDSSGDLVSATDVLGQTWTYVYDSNHHMTQANDPAGKETVKSEYDEEGRANRQVDGEGNLIVQIVYNNDGSTTVYDALGHENEHQYNEHNIATETVDPLGRTEIKEFDDNFRPKTITNDANQTLAMEWSADGVNLESKTDAAGNYTDYEYDSLNNLTSVIDPRGNTTTYTYDGKLLTSSEDALGGDTTYTYTPEGYLESVTDTAGRVTSYEYDSFGQRISMTDPSENTWEYTYDPQGLGRLINTTDPRGRVTHNEYNAAGKLVRVTQNYVPAHPQNYQNLYNIVTEYEYDVRGNQVAVTDTYNRTTQYVYDDADRLLQTIDPAGNTTTNAYDEAGRLISTTDPLLHTTTYEYDATGRLVKTINPLGFHSGTTTFNVSNNTSTVTDMLTRQTVFHYDELGRVVEVVDPLGNSTTTTYDENGNVETHTDQLGRTTTYEYDELNRLVKTIDPNGGETETVYDASGNRTAAIDPLDHQMTYTYDSVGRLVATTDPLNRVTQTEYDEFGRRSVSVDAAGRETTYTYDLLDRVIEVTDPDGNTTTTTYDALGNVLTRTDANGNTTTTTYDALNRPLVATDANGNETTNAYDAGGNLISVTDALGQTTTYTYDALNRRKTVTDPLGNTTEYFYDVFGNLLDTEDANEVVTHYEYDELNRQVAVILNHKPGVPADAETNVRYEFDYNEVGNRVSVKDPNCNVTTYGYDALNRVTSKSDPLTNTWTYTYDLAGNRISTIDAKNQTIQYTYDAGGQLTIIDYPGSEPDVTFTYDLTGQRLSMTDGLGTTTWTYDNLNRPTSVTDAFGKTVGYDYDAVGNRVQLIYPDGKTVAYEYDDLNQLTGVTDWDNQDTGYTYDAVGQLESVSLPNGITSQYSYDDAGRLSELQHEAGANTLASYNYAYDPAGNRIQAIEDLVLPIVPPTPTPTFTETNTPSFTPTETYTPSSTASPTETQTLTPTFTPTDTATPTNTPTQVPSPTPTNAPGGTGTTEIKIGETYVLGNDDSGHGNLLVAQNVVLSQEATIQSLSFYVTTAAGNLRLGIYNDANGNPGTLVAKTDEFTPVVGWNTQSVQTPVLLPAGTYWLAYRPESSDLHFRNTWTGDGENSLRYYSYPYGEMPSTFSASAQSADYQFSFYATFTVAVEPGTIYLGEVNVLHFEADGSGNLLIMQETELPNNAVLQSVSFYVTNAVGKVRLGIYDNNWLNRPETLMAETNEFTPVVGWNTVDVQTPTLLPAGTYWLAFLIESDDLEFKYAWVQGLYTGRVYGYPFGEMPSSVSQQPVGVEYHFSLYATFMEDDSLTLPATEILDDFNRTDGSIGGNWSGDAAEFNIASNQLTVTSNHVMIGWNGTSFGADQEAYVTLSRLDTGSANEHGLVLKSQSAGTLQDGAIQVVYDGSGERIRVWTYTPGYGWAKYGSDISVAFVDGDVFSARALSDGWLDMYRNGTLIGKRNLSAWPYMAQGGYIGLKSYQIQDAIVDDFGGGTLEGGEALMGMASSSSGSESLDAATEFIVLSSQFNANAKMDPIFGQSAPAEQKAYITFPPADSGKQNPLEKTQDKETKDGTIQVVFDVTGGRIQILIYDSQKGWVQRGRDISAKFADGDRFRASLQDDGTLEIYRNGKLLAQRKLSSLPQRDVSMISTPELSIDNASFQPVSYRPSGMSAPIPSAPPGAVNELPYLPLPDLPLQQPASLTIDYTYDALHRLTGATFSDGRSFGYTYDAAGNVLELEQDLGPGTVTTTYTYNAANELFTAQKDGTTWNYTYDANGSLTEVLPNGNPGNGAKRYTYNSAGNLVQVEAHNGTDWDTQAEMDYSGLGQRLSMDAAGVIATYVMDGDRPLAAESAGNTTFYLYGLGAIAEKTTAWSYSLPDGTNTPRQLTNSNGEITLSSRYTPWGDTLETYGTGNFSFGYLGGVLDATTGLLYVGNGQYYDPATGRFLTRNVNPDSTNPYAPWNPIGAIVGPLGLIALVFGRKKKGSKAGTFLMLLLVVGSVGMTLAACGSEPTKVTAVFTPINAQTQLVEATLENGDNMTLVVPVTPTTTPGYFCGLAAPTGTNESELNLTLDELVDYIRKTNGASPDYSIVRGQLKRLMEISGNRGLSTNHLAYLYATIQVETNWVDFQEKGDSSYFRRYDGILGNIENGDGERYKGRGFIHLTGRENYRKASEYLNLRVLGDDGKTEFAELEAYPERAFWRPDTPGNSRGYDYSANIAVYGMADGWFTGKSLFDSEFNNPDGSYNFYEARAIINWPGATSNATQRASDLGNGFAEILRKHCQLGGVLPGINCVVCQ